MCTFNHETAVTVCDVAIGPVRSNLEEAFPGAIRFTHLEGAGTLVEADSDLEPVRFAAVVKRAIAQAELVSESDPAAPR